MRCGTNKINSPLPVCLADFANAFTFFFEVIVVNFPVANGVGVLACNGRVYSREGDAGVKRRQAANNVMQ